MRQRLSDKWPNIQGWIQTMVPAIGSPNINFYKQPTKTLWGGGNNSFLCKNNKLWLKNIQPPHLLLNRYIIAASQVWSYFSGWIYSDDVKNMKMVLRICLKWLQEKKMEAATRLCKLFWNRFYQNKLKWHNMHCILHSTLYCRGIPPFVECTELMHSIKPQKPKGKDYCTIIN